MRIGMVGLGRMGANLVRRLLRDGHGCVVTDLDGSLIPPLEEEGAEGASSLEELVAALGPPGERLVWVMVPSGRAAGAVLSDLGGLLAPGDVVIDGGNSHYRDTLERATRLAERGIQLVDVGTSGGLWGLERGFCLMVGGPAETFARLEPILASLAPGPGDLERTPALLRNPETSDRRRPAESGYLHCGPVGAGHFVKMVHNGIEYGVMQAYAEGLDLLRSSASDSIPQDERFAVEPRDVAELWRRGSVIGSWLLDLTANALARDPDLSTFDGRVDDSGEGRWAVQTSVERAVPTPAMTAALYARFRSRGPRFADRVLSAMRSEFGGHAEAGNTDAEGSG